MASKERQYIMLLLAIRQRKLWAEEFRRLCEDKGWRSIDPKRPYDGAEYWAEGLTPAEAVYEIEHGIWLAAA